MLRRNIPQAFAEEEVADFDAFPDKLPEPYYVFEQDTFQVACRFFGKRGYALTEIITGNRASICTGYARPYKLATEN